MVIPVWVKLLWSHGLNLFCLNIQLNVRINGFLWIREESYSIILKLSLYLEAMVMKFCQQEPNFCFRMVWWSVHIEQFLKVSDLYSLVPILTSNSGHMCSFMSYEFKMIYLELDNWNPLFFNSQGRKIISNIFEFLDVEFGYNLLTYNVVNSKMMQENVYSLVTFFILIT